MHRVRLWAAAALVLVAGNGCGGSDATGPTSGEIRLTPDAVIIAQGQGLQLSVSVLDDQGRLLAGTPVAFASSDTLMVTVSPTGAVHSVGPAGFATVTARAGRLSAEVAVAVTPTASRLAVTPATLTMPQKGTAQLSGVLLDAAGDPVPHSPVTYASTNTAVVTVSTDGVVTSIGPAGQAEINVFSGRLFVPVPVTVPQTPFALFVTPNPVTIFTGASVQLAARVADAVGAEIVGSSFAYAAAPASLIAVTPAGLLSSVGGAGTGTVTVTSGPLRLEVPVTVKQQVPTSIAVSPNPITLAVGHSIQTSARVLDADQVEIAGSAFTYTAAPATLITVSATGVVSSVGGAGTGTLTVQSGTLQLVVPVTVAELGHPVGSIVATTPMSNRPWGAAVSSSGVVYVVGVDNLLGRADLPSYSLITTPLATGVTTAVAFNQAGTQAWIPNAPSGSVAVYDPSTNAVTGTVGGLDGDVYGVLVSPDDQTVYVGTGNNSVYAINATTRTIQWQVMAAGPVIHLAHHPTLPLLYASTPGAISEIDLTTHSARTLSASVGHAQAIAVSADGSELYIADENGAGLDVYNLGTGQTTNLSLGCSGYGLALSPDDAVIYLSCVYPGQVLAIDRVTKTVISTFATNGTPHRLAMSPDGLTLVAPNEAGWVDFIR